MAKIGEVTVTIKADTHHFDRALRRMGRSIRRTNRATRRMNRAWYRRRRSPRVLGARSTAVWATCYVYVAAVPRALRCYAPGIIRDFLVVLGVLFLFLLALAAYGLYPR